MEDLDRPRVVAGADREILEALRRYALVWDGEVVHQSERVPLYEKALATLRGKGVVFDCACSRADLRRSASAPAATDPAEGIYPGTCRDGVPPGREARAVRFRAPDRVIAFDDLIFGRIEEEVAQRTGDFVVKRADGAFAYQLAVVVDDEAQGVTQVVRGADLLDSTARQIALQQALDYRTPEYAHLPLVMTAGGAKAGKRDGALPVPSLNDVHVAETLQLVLHVLGFDVPRGAPQAMLQRALEIFEPGRIPRESFVVQS